ncbi:MAG TPA: hypothetical protein VHB48_16020, partial [Chitinophagaceae bacterium]|nr:hypothetical protein [Chitinophagaceae bacterium]
FRRPGLYLGEASLPAYERYHKVNASLGGLPFFLTNALTMLKASLQYYYFTICTEITAPSLPVTFRL